MEKIDDKICPHCNIDGGRSIHGSISTDGSYSLPITICNICKKEIKDCWWCETCQDMIEPEHVTYDEKHDPRFGGCGMPVI